MDRKATLHLVAGSLMFALAGVPPAAGGDLCSSGPAEKWSLAVAGGVHTTRTIGRAALSIPGRLTNHHLYGLALSRKMGEIGSRFSWEAEAMAAGHRDRRSGFRQDYLEVTAAALLRYHGSLRGGLLPFSLAAGNGLSYASEGPAIEEDLRNGRSRRLLNYLALELAAALPAAAGTELIYRIHHRSGVFGLFGGVKGASDFYVLGLRKRF